MKKGFMMIELCVVMLGLVMLVSLSYKVILETSIYDLNYHFITVTTNCEILCVLKKHIP
ncbi:MAG: hypothetical protein FD133_1636 [Erysipelotrichaceae bacterium]|nr:MAG: hypothetical protein FD179_674 [Erysipelotrichaceae bacterium]TXT16859.1 MAG: hypothetical protein FD133_1636 [Erysipelotrichaceae bacterium]